MATLASSFLSEATYDADKDIITVTLKSGKVYQVHNVPESVFETFIQAPSAGAYFNSVLRIAYPVSEGD